MLLQDILWGYLCCLQIHRKLINRGFKTGESLYRPVQPFKPHIIPERWQRREFLPDNPKNCIKVFSWMTSKASFSIRITFYSATQRETSTDITKAGWKSNMFSQYLFNLSSLPQDEKSWKEKGSLNEIQETRMDTDLTIPSLHLPAIIICKGHDPRWKENVS